MSRETITLYGYIEVDFEGVILLMNEELREQLRHPHTPYSPQEFFEAYCIAHKERFNEDFMKKVI